MLIDTHCHIYLEQFDEDLDEVLYRASETGIRHIYMPAINFDSLPKMDRMEHPQISFHKMAGIHPTEINNGIRTSQNELGEICNSEEIVAVGETGLDYHWSTDFKEEQQQSLHRHCQVAKELGKSIVLHNRGSTADLLDIIEEEQDGNLRGVWHCFNGTVQEGKKAIDLGLMLGIGGVLTFKNAGVDRSVAQLPLGKMILETDAPYLAPAPNRGKRNEPSYVRLTALRLAEVMEVSLNQIEEITTGNASRLFGLDT